MGRIRSIRVILYYINKINGSRISLSAGLSQKEGKDNLPGFECRHGFALAFPQTCIHRASKDQPRGTEEQEIWT